MASRQLKKSAVMTLNRRLLLGIAPVLLILLAVGVYAIVLFQHLRNNGLSGKISAFEVGIQKPVEVSFINVEKCPDSENAGVVYQYIC